MRGVVSVPVQVSQAVGEPDEAIIVRWAWERPAGYQFDVQYRFKAPDSASYGDWEKWRRNTWRIAGVLRGNYFHGEGTYQIRARLENIKTHNTSWWSVPTAVMVMSQDESSRIDSVCMYHENDRGDNEEVPDCVGTEGVALPEPSCIWSERLREDGDLEVVVYTTTNGRWRGHG